MRNSTATVQCSVNCSASAVLCSPETYSSAVNADATLLNKENISDNLFVGSTCLPAGRRTLPHQAGEKRELYDSSVNHDGLSGDVV